MMLQNSAINRLAFNMASAKTSASALVSPDTNALMESMLSVMSDLDLNHVLIDIVTRAARLVGTQHGFIDLVNAKGISLEGSYRIGIFRNFVAEETQQGAGVSGTVWQTGKPLLIEDYNTWSNRLSKVSHNTVYGVMAVPVRSREGSTIGVLGMAHISPEEKFTATQVEFLARFAQLAAVAIDNARLYNAAQREIEDRKRAEIAREQVLTSLEQVVTERTRELSAILNATQIVNANLGLNILLDAVLEQLNGLISFDSAAIRTLENGTHLRMVAYTGPTPPEQRAQDWPFDETHLHVQQVIQEQKPFIIPDTQADDLYAQAHRQRFLFQYGYVPDSIRSWMGVPLLAHGQVLGILITQSSQCNHFTQDHARIALAFANQATVAIENARLFHAEQEHRVEAERSQQVSAVLSSVLRILNSSQPIDTILQFVLKQAEQWLGNAAGIIFRLDPHSNQLLSQSASGGHDLQHKSLSIDLRSNTLDLLLRDNQPIAIADLVRSPYLRAHDSAADARLKALKSQYRSALLVPLSVRDELYGVVALFYDQEHHFPAEYLKLAASMCDQLALAIENARLRESAVRNAASAERSRLARELHDSVSQALYAMVLMMRTAREMLNRDARQAIMPIDEAVSLADGALTEMRALIFELRPESLEQEGLIGALRKQVTALTARHKIDVQTHFCLEEPRLSIEAKEALYRIGLEAIQNTIKHASASRVQLHLTCDDEYAMLEVMDNGDGFNPDRDYPGHLGLHSMRERAELHNGMFTIQSEPGNGATVRVRVPLVIQSNESDMFDKADEIDESDHEETEIDHV